MGYDWSCSMFGEQSGVYKIMFVADQAFAIAAAVISFQAYCRFG
ncbi:hypothetical protein J489_3859 [Acinetobacter baumannii 1040094]|nr:hypothetical protein J489_3859 [Acinetobacter baumannii 1040094]